MLRGGERPTFEQPIEYEYSEAQDAIEMFEAYGRNYYEAQKYQMLAFYARKADGSYAAPSIGISEPRQNGKSFGARDYGLDSACMGGKSVLFSAHHGKTVRSMFKAMCNFVTSTPDFNDELNDIYKAAGSEGIYFDDGCVEFQTRTNNASRGGTYDIVIIDEAQELTDAQLEALLPVISASSELSESKGTQVIYLGTPPNETCVGTVFSSMHDKAHKGSNSVWWMEWAAQGESIKDVPLDDKELWYACNPAMGRRMSETAVQNERDTMSDAGFARERLGWWPIVEYSQRIITENQWNSCLVESRPSEGIDSLGIKYSSDGSTVSVSVCRKDGDAHFVELLFNEPTSKGTAWLVDFIIERTKKYACTVIDGQYGAQSLMDRLDGQVPRNFIIRPKIADVISAHTTFKDYVGDGRIQHTGQPQLANSVTKSSKRAIGKDGGFGWKSNEAADASIVESAALAVHGSDKTKRNPNRKTGVAF